MAPERNRTCTYHFTAMLWRMWTLVVSVLRWMTPRPGFLLPMSVNANAKVANGVACTSDGSSWKDQKAEFLRNPSLRRSRELQQEQWQWYWQQQTQKQKQRAKEHRSKEQHHRRRFFDFGFGSGYGGSSKENGEEKEKENKPTKNTSNKWRKRQPSTNAFVFVTPPSILLPPSSSSAAPAPAPPAPPPTVTIQDFSSTPLPPSLTLSSTFPLSLNPPLTLNLPPPLPLSLALPPSIGALEAVGKSNAPPRPPRPPSGPIPRVVITPVLGDTREEGGVGGRGLARSQPLSLSLTQPGSGSGSGNGGQGEQEPDPRVNAQLHFRSSSGRHLSPEWGLRSPPPSPSPPSSSPSSSSLSPLPSPPPSPPAPSTSSAPAPASTPSFRSGGHTRTASISTPLPSAGVPPGSSSTAGGHPNTAPARTNFSRPRSTPSSRDRDSHSQPSVYSHVDSQPGGSATGNTHPPLPGNSGFGSSRFSASSSVSTSSASSSSASSSSTGSASSFQSNSIHEHDVHDTIARGAFSHGPRKIGLGILGEPQTQAEGLNPSGSFLSTISEAGSFASLHRSGPMSASEAHARGTYASNAQVQAQPQAQTQPLAGVRKVHLSLPEEQLDLLPYPEVFDLDMYFSRSQSQSQAHRRTSVYDFAYAPSLFLPHSPRHSYSQRHSQEHQQHQQQRLSLCVLRNARVEDIRRMQAQMQEQEDLQSRQSESVKDFMTAAFDAFVPSPPALHGYLGLGSDGEGDSDLGLREDSDDDGAERKGEKEKKKENSVPGFTTAHAKLRRVPTSPSRLHGPKHARSRSVGGGPHRMRSHTHPRTPRTYIQDAERQVGGGGVAAAGAGAASRPILRQVGNVGPSMTTRTTTTTAGNGKTASTLKAGSPASTSSSPNPNANRPASTLRVLVPSPAAPAPAHARPVHIGSSSDPHPHVARPPAPAAHLQIRVPGLSQRVVNRTKESELSPIKEAFHPPSMAVLSPPPPSPPFHISTFTSGDKSQTEKEEQSKRRPRPPTLPIVIVSHHRFGSVSEYDDGGESARESESENGSGSGNEREDQEALYYRYHSESSGEEDSVRRCYAVGGVKTRLPGHGRDHGEWKGRKRRGRWPSSDLAYLDEESGMEVVSLH